MRHERAYAGTDVMGKGTPEARRRASRNYYFKNRDAIRAKRNAQARANPRKKDRTTIKERARNKLRQAVYYGKIIKPRDCEGCGSRALLNGHHHDYSKPLEVQWLCSPCHGQAHSAAAISRAEGRTPTGADNG